MRYKFSQVHFVKALILLFWTFSDVSLAYNINSFCGHFMKKHYEKW